nr:IS630 family transposase [Microvirga ossetica]
MDLAAAGRRDREALRRAHLALTAFGRVAPKGDFRWRRPRHTLKGRQDADAVDRAGLRRKLLKAQAEAGDIVLLFGDESEALTHPYLAHAWAKKGADLRIPAPGQALTHPYLAHAWAKKGADLRIPAPGQAAKVAMLGLLDWAPRDLIVRTSRSKRSADFIALLDQIDTQYGPTSARATKPIVLVLDNGPIHTSKATRAALAERAPWLTVEWLPKYAPELNAIEELWRDLKQHHLAHQTFAGPENLDDAIHEAVAMLNCERSRHPLANHRIAA